MTRKTSTGVLDYVLVGVVLAVIFGLIGLLADTVLSAIFAAFIGFVIGAFGPLAFDAFLRRPRSAPGASGSAVDDIGAAVRQLADTGIARLSWRALHAALFVPKMIVAIVLGGLGMLLAVVRALLPSERSFNRMLNNPVTLIVLFGSLILGGAIGTIIWGFEVAFYIALALTPIWLIAMIVLSITPPANLDDKGEES